MAVQNKDELEMLLAKAEAKLKALQEQKIVDTRAVYRTEIEIKKWQNLLGGNEKQADIETVPVPPVMPQDVVTTNEDANKAKQETAKAEPAKVEATKTEAKQEPKKEDAK